MITNPVEGETRIVREKGDKNECEKGPLERKYGARQEKIVR
jgi:hypothetical protein